MTHNPYHLAHLHRPLIFGAIQFQASELEHNDFEDTVKFGLIYRFIENYGPLLEFFP